MVDFWIVSYNVIVERFKAITGFSDTVWILVFLRIWIVWLFGLFGLLSFSLGSLGLWFSDFLDRLVFLWIPGYWFFRSDIGAFESINLTHKHIVKPLADQANKRLI